MHPLVETAIAEANRGHAELILRLIKVDNPKLIDALLAVDKKASINGTLDVHCHDKDSYEELVAVLKDNGYTSGDRVEDWKEYKSCVFYSQDVIDAASVWLYYQPSVVCRTILKGYETKQVPIYEKVCDPIDPTVPDPVIDEILL